MPRHLLERDRISLLEAVHRLRFCDREMLAAVLGDTYTESGVKYAVRKLRQAGYLRTTEYLNRGYRREVIFLGLEAANVLQLPREEQDRIRHRVDKLLLRETGFRHEMMISRMYAFLLTLARTTGVQLVEFARGEDSAITWKEGEKNRRVQPDAVFVLSNGHVKLRYCLEADTGNERIVSYDADRKTIRKKVERYAYIKEHRLYPKAWGGFHVLFLTPPRGVTQLETFREQNMLEVAQEFGGKTMFCFLPVSLLNLKEPDILLNPHLKTNKPDKPLVALVPKPDLGVS